MITAEQALKAYLAMLVKASAHNPRLKNFLKHHRVTRHLPNGIPVCRTQPRFWTRDRVWPKPQVEVEETGPTDAQPVVLVG